MDLQLIMGWPVEFLPMSEGSVELQPTVCAYQPFDALEVRSDISVLVRNCATDL